MYATARLRAYGVENVKETIKNAIQGVTPLYVRKDVTCRVFWHEGLSVLEAQFPDCIDRVAAGFTAVGFEHASQYNGFAPGFQIYLTESDYAAYGAEMQNALDQLPTEFEGVVCRSSGLHTFRIYTIDGFFREKTFNGVASGTTQAPDDAFGWLRIPESALFDLTEGLVFYDPFGEFTRRRREFLNYYPDDVWKKRLAASLYNAGLYAECILSSALAANDYQTAEIAWRAFNTAAMKAGFLLSHCHAPHLAELYREFCKLPDFAVDVVNLLWEGQSSTHRRARSAERIAAIYRLEIEAMGFECSSGANLMKLANCIAATIKDPKLARMGIDIEIVHC